MIVITNAHHTLEGFVMNENLEGFYWKVGDNEWRLQISFSNNQKAHVLESFSSWSIAGEGNDPKENKNIKIFSRKFKNHSELEVFITELKSNNNISLKEV